jgi:hypothetical protein
MSKPFAQIGQQDLLTALERGLHHYSAAQLDEFAALSKLCLPSATMRLEAAAAAAECREKDEDDEHHASGLASLAADRIDYR